MGTFLLGCCFLTIGSLIGELFEDIDIRDFFRCIRGFCVLSLFICTPFWGAYLLLK